MREVWKEIWQGMEIKIILAVLLSLTIIIAVLFYSIYCSSTSNVEKKNQNDPITHLFINPIQTNFTS